MNIKTYFKRRRVSRKTVYKISAFISLFGLIGCIGQGTPSAPDEKPSVTQIIAQLEGLPIDEFFEESFRQLQLRDPDTLIYNELAQEYGMKEYDQFTIMSDHYIRETQQLESGILNLLRGYNRSTISPEQQLSYDIYEWYLSDQVRRHEFMYYNYPVNSVGLWDTPYWLINSLFDSLSMTSLQDAQNYIARLSRIDTWMEQLLEQLTLREKAGVIPPKFLVQRSIDLVDYYIQKQEDGTCAVQTIHLYTLFCEKLEKIEDVTDEQKQTLLNTALTEIEQTFIPAFIKLRDYLIYLESVAIDTPGVGTLPQGEAFYTYILRHWTGTDLTPSQIHELGLTEVARIQAEMRTTAVHMGYPEDISMAELDQLFTDTDFLRGDSLKKEYERLIAEADEAMKEFFDLRPKAEVIVTYDPDAPSAYYQAPPKNGSGPGHMVANLANSAQYIYYNPTVLVHHETIPGHHVQIALAQELDLPTNFRRDIIYNFYKQHVPFQAYSEGWALYAEGLAWEMGLYKNDSLSNLGRLRLQLHRTARLVVDTGIHAKGWTLKEAINYLEEATGSPYTQDQLAHIVAVPGQACGYTIGMLKILELRQIAMEQLGDKFDIKEFHNMILGHGPMPIQLMEQVALEWIAANLGK
ncbi:MAG: DUF885 domain-containing protein [Theionarchaea archaeon]|nr:DUF885 domain-containing protein [Theionarchaea archaeon]